jgi:putative nucleotidyltransferase with HDIG domain
MKPKTKTLSELLHKADELPPLPIVAQKALRLLSNPEFNMAQLSDLLATDEAMTSLVLRWANSSYYGLVYPVSTVHQAVTYLGEITIRSLVLTISLASYMNRPLPGYGLDRGDLWKHSVGVAVATRLVASKFGRKQAEEAYTAGLLCDIGKLVFESILRDINTNTEEWSGSSFNDLETNFFGINHAELGAELARHWGFPVMLQGAIAYHHNPSESTMDPFLPSAVHIGDALVSMLGIGVGKDGLQYVVDPQALNILKLQNTNLDTLLSQIVVLVKDAEKLIS